MKNIISNYLEQFQSAIKNLDKSEIEKFINILLKVKIRQKALYIMGNGGSCAIASHFVCDLNRLGFNIKCLNDNIPTITALANDKGFENIFVEQLKEVIKEGDLIIGLSTSGNSKNIIKAFEYAKTKNAVTIGVLGSNGGKLKEICDYSINTNVNNMQISEDIFMVLCHTISIALENKKQTEIK